MTDEIEDHVHDQNGAHMTVDVAVVGGGLAGLAAAATAARGGCRVVVLEAHLAGGRARSVERNGYTLNQGAHALYLGGAAGAVLDQLGVVTTGGEPPADEYRTFWNGRVVPLPLTPKGLLTTRLLGVRSKATAARLLGSIGSAARNAPDVPLEEWMEHERVRPDLARVLCVVARLTSYTARPELAPAPAMLRQLALGGGGARYVDGGWQTIVDGLLAAARRAGARVVTGAPVTELARDRHGRDGHWMVRAGNRTVAARSVVIATGGPAHAEALAGRGPGWTETAGVPVRAACLDVGLGGLVGSPPVRYLFSADDPLYLSQHAPVARVAPDGHDLYQLLRYLGSDEHLSPAQARAELEQHAARAGLPPTGERTVERFLADMTVAWGSHQVGVLRPRGDELAAHGIHVAGDWVGDHLLADAALDSGARAGRAAGVAAATGAAVRMGA
ncbi:FAD-dependent oxidoreductase [soil metagenome]